MSPCKKFRLCFIIMISIVLLFMGCASQQDEAATDSVPAYETADESSRSRQDSGQTSPETAAAPEETFGGGGIHSTVHEHQHKIIYTGEAIVETLDFEESVAGIQRYVESMGGYAEYSYIEGQRLTAGTRNARRTASFTFRIPRQQFHRFSDGLTEFGNLLSSSSHGENITDRYFDTEARLKSLQIQEERLLALLERAEDIETILRIESELSSLRYQIENLTGTLQKWDNLVDFATYHVDIREVDAVTPDPAASTWGTDITNAFHESVIAVIHTLKNLVIFFIMVIPFAIVFLPVFFIARAVFRKIRSLRQKRHSHENQASEIK